MNLFTNIKDKTNEIELHNIMIFEAIKNGSKKVLIVMISIPNITNGWKWSAFFNIFALL